MFAVSLQDRLKAAVNTLEATGTSLQARAIANQQLMEEKEREKDKTGSRPGTPHTPAVSGTTASGTDGVTSPKESLSPTKVTAPAAYASSSQLAENAISGLRRSFNFNRSSSDLAGLAKSPRSEEPTMPGGKPSDDLGGSEKFAKPGAASPGQSLQLPKDFVLGSVDASGATSPLSLTGSFLQSGTVTPTASQDAKRSLPPPNPDDPASIPLPPSPALSAVSVTDPLGAASELPSQSSVGLGIALPDGEIDEVLEEIEKEQSAQENGKVSGEDGKDITDLERRYKELSHRFTSLLTTTHTANQVFRTLTPLESGISDPEALEGWVRMMTGKVELMGGEMKRLQGQMTLQDSRIEELRDTHRLESSSQQELITKLRTDLSEAQAKASNSAADSSTIAQLRTDLSKAQTSAKEEEEKRTKAISLLKTVRLKLVKTEKEKEDLEKDRASERAERSRAIEDVERIKAEKEKEVNNLRKGFERESQALKDRWEKDVKDKKAAWELEMITTKATHAKELSQKQTKVNGLESIVKELNSHKQKTFTELQAKEAEAEQARAEIDSLQTKARELGFQLREMKESEERRALLEDGLRDGANAGGRSQSGLGLGPPGAGDDGSRPSSRSASFSASSPLEIQRLLAEAESRAEVKLSDLRARLKHLETERNSLEEDFNLKLSERVRELEKMRRVVEEKEEEYKESLRMGEEWEKRVSDGEDKIRALEGEIIKMKTRVEEVKGDKAVMAEAERSARDEISTLQQSLASLQSQLDESRTHITHLKSTNKTLREEMRKVQSSVQLMERSRNPGVGYWAARDNMGGLVSPPATNGIESPGTPGNSSRRSLESVRTTTATELESEQGKSAVADEEEVNLEYLRNVILQFLEHREMRPNLIRVMSVILRFTPQELRRLNAKLLS